VWKRRINMSKKRRCGGSERTLREKKKDYMEKKKRTAKRIIG
jgi:hypothetical protein